ncbi:hypothetical protein [Psychroserpens burtonensis]|uniref:hypothetical protein n=1 Tax=Psychroserpens burtonensis TaxID=49278 RepID=UPI00041D7E0E|nr:hypothetical protein [Psychroserpens burtonensis]
MRVPILETKHVKLTLLTLNNYVKLIAIAQEKDLTYYSPSTISSSEKLKDYFKVAVDGYLNQTAIPFIIYDKVKQQYSGSTRFGLIH